MAKQWQATRDDGLDLGIFDSQDEAEEAAADDARESGDPIHTWTRVFGGAHAKSDSHRYDIKQAR
jgi:hypothetical protein